MISFVLLKKLLSIFFLSVYLLSATEARELLKFPVIFQHYQEHKLLNKTITLLEFLDIHYMHGSPHDEDYDRDMQLPFKTCIQPTGIMANVIVPSPFFVLVPVVYFIEKRQLLSYTNSRYSCNFHSSIWQPPRFS